MQLTDFSLTYPLSPEYLEHAARGIASGDWLYDYGLQTTRGFRALKVWLSLQEHGVEKFGRLIDQNVAQARYLTELVEVHPALELVAPTSINIVCFRFNPYRLPSLVSHDGPMDEETIKALNIEIMQQMQEKGVAAVSDTTIKGRHALRAAIANHRTQRSDLDMLVDQVVRLGKAIGKTV